MTEELEPWPRPAAIRLYSHCDACIKYSRSSIVIALQEKKEQEHQRQLAEKDKQMEACECDVLCRDTRRRVSASCRHARRCNERMLGRPDMLVALR